MGSEQSNDLKPSPHKSTSPGPARSTPGPVPVKRQILGAVGKNGQKIFVKAVLPSNLKIAQGSNLKKPLILTQIPFSTQNQVKTRHVRFSIKYFGKDAISWDTREKALCRITSQKKPFQVKYPNSDFSEKKMTLVSFPVYQLSFLAISSLQKMTFSNYLLYNENFFAKINAPNARDLFL